VSISAIHDGLRAGLVLVGFILCIGSAMAQPVAAAYRSKIVALVITKTEQGNAEAENVLGMMYAKGRGVKHDYKQAVRWYKKSASQGYADAQYHLGKIFYDGKGVAQDYHEAAAWFHKAADQGNAPAQFAIGLMYARGFSVPRDDAEAKKWFRIASAHEIKDDKWILTEIYLKKLGMPADEATIIGWLGIAGVMADYEPLLDDATTAQIVKAVHMAETWRAQRPM